MSGTWTPHEAARVLSEASGYERAIERRTEGLTMMVWGLVNSALFLAYGLAAVLGAPWQVMAVLWVPWVGFGVLLTHALWRSAALSRDRPMLESTGAAWLRIGGVTLAIALVFAFVQPTGPALPLIIIGAAYAGIGALNLFRSHAEERRLTLLAGTLLLVTGAALEVTRASLDVAGGVGIAAPLVILGGLGLWQTARG